MKLYSWVKNERGIGKKQGGHKNLEITLEYEETGQSWECNSSEHELRVRFTLIDGTPHLAIMGNEKVVVEDYRKVVV